MVWGAKAAWGAGGGASGDRARLPKGSEPCHICGEDSMCEVKLKPCNHEMCLSCCNTMRQGIVFKADAGLKCPFCRDYVDGFTDMNGRSDTIPDLVEANRAAHKSRVARKTGMDKAVSTGVPDPQRLVPPIGRSTSTASAAAAASEPGWTCPACRRTNAAGRAECTHCRTPHPDRALGPAKDLLTCSDDEVARTLCERSHASLYRSLQDAGMPHDKAGGIGSLGGNSDSIRQALRARRHERLMKAAHVLAAPMYCERVATHEWGNYAVQNVLEGAHRLRMEANALQQQDALPPENFAWAPVGSSSGGGSAGQPMAMTAFSKLLATLTSASMLHNLCMSEQGVHVLLRLIKLSSPPETTYILNQIMHDLPDMVVTKGGALVVCSLIDRLSVAANCDNAGAAERATASIVRLCGHLYQHNRSLQQCARHQYLGPKVAELLQCGLPATDAFKMGYELVQNAPALAATRHGCRTLQLLTEIRAGDARTREMLRDIVCYASKTLQGHFGQLASKGETGGPALVRALLDFLLADREDDWVVQITKELVLAGNDLRRDREAHELLVHSLALPLWRPPETQQHWAALQAAGVDVAVLKPKVDAARQHEPRLRERVLPSLSEVQPSSPAESVKRYPRYLRDGGQAVRNSALRKPPPPPPREQDQQQQPKAAPPGFGAAAAAASASAAGPAAVKVPPPGFAAAQSAAPAAAPATVTFPNGTSVPMPQPYSATTSAALAPSTSRAAAAEPKQQASSAPAAAAPVASKPAPPAAPQQPVPPAAPATVPAPSALKPAAPPQQAAPLPRPAPMQPAAPQAPVPQPAAAPQAPAPAQQPAPVQPSMAARPAVPVPPPAAPGMNASARPFVQPPPPQAARPLIPQLQPNLQQQQQQQQAPAHLQALPPHLRQPAPAAVGSSAGPAGMPAPITPVPSQHPAGGYAQPPAPQQLLQQLLGNAAPRPAAPAPAPLAVRPPAPGMVPAPQHVAAAQGSAGAFNGYGSLTEMLSELTAAAAPQPVAPARPAYRPAYRPPGAVAYRPPTATALPPAPAPAPAPAAPRPVGVPAPSPAARFPMPGAPRPAPPPAAAPAAPAAPARAAAPAVPVAAASTWDCKVCTYRHEGAESQFLSCAMCGSPQS